MHRPAAALLCAYWLPILAVGPVGGLSCSWLTHALGHLWWYWRALGLSATQKRAAHGSCSLPLIQAEVVGLVCTETVARGRIFMLVLGPGRAVNVRVHAWTV